MSNGPRAILGLCALTHDSSAALLVDGCLVGFVEEERLTGEKHTRAFPAQSVEWLLDEAGLPNDDLAVVAYNFDGRHYLGALTQMPRHLINPTTRRRAIARARSFATLWWKHRRRRSSLATRFPSATIQTVLHHRAHGLYAFASSRYEEAAILVVDSLGEMQTTTICHAHVDGAGRCRYRILRQVRDPASLGYAYGAVTEHLGWRRGDEEGTVMALAALGDPERFRPLMARAIGLTSESFALDPALFTLRVIGGRHPRMTPTFVAATCPPRQAQESVEQVHADLAAALQERTEQVMLHLAARTRAVAGSKYLCLSGGVATNCVAAGRIAEARLFDEIHVPPAPGDSGTAIGAAIGAQVSLTGRLPSGVGGRCYLGPASTQPVLSDRPRRGLAARRVSDGVGELADALADDRIVGVFRGRLEAGPRALGNRSILASPLNAAVVDRLNSTVKYREPFRPFAPVVLADKAADYFTLPQLSPYMAIASGVTALTRQRMPAVVHLNGRARVQTVTREQNPFIADVLDAFGQRTGVPVLINTSLNVKGKPICGTPEMALDCLAESGMDALLMEDWWVSK